jgi:hypothetical protein
MDSRVLQQFLEMLDVGAPHLRIGREVRALPLPPVLDKPGLGQFLDVVGKRGRRDRKPRLQVGAGQFVTRRNALENFQSRGVPQRSGNLLYAAFMHVSSILDARCPISHRSGLPFGKGASDTELVFWNDVISHLPPSFLSTWS